MTYGPSITWMPLARPAINIVMTARRRAIEFKAFLDLLYETVPLEPSVHVVLDNSSTQRRRLSSAGWSSPSFRVLLHADFVELDGSG
jgi:hypothetical protein